MNTTNQSPAGVSTAASRAARRKPRRSGNKTTQTLVFLLIALLAGGGAYWFFLAQKAQAGTTPNSVTYTATVERGDISVTATGSGTLVTNQSINMAFSTSGKVAELNVKLGDMIKTGDVLARLEKAEDLEANLASAQANLLVAQQALEALQKKAGSILAQAYQNLLDAQETYDDQLTASQRTAYARCGAETVSKYKTALQSAAQKRNELYELAPSSPETTIAQYDYDTALANYTYCAAYTATEVTSAAANLEIARSSLEEARADYEKLREASGIDPDKLAIYETQVESAQTQVDTAQEALDGITLTAAMDGKITYLAASAGAIVDTSTFLTISDVSHPTVTISLDETDMDALIVGNPASITFTALPGETFHGQVTLASPEMIAFGPFRAASGQVSLNEEYAKPFESLPLGMSATIDITGQEAKDVLLVPIEALIELRDGSYAVDLVSSDGQIAQQTVTVGLQNDTSAEITSGLQEGDVIRVTRSIDSSGNPFGGEMFPGGDMPQGGGMRMP